VEVGDEQVVEEGTVKRSEVRFERLERGNRV
jgi:hypothetical protein